MCQFVRVAAIVFVFASSALAQFDFKDVQLRTAYAWLEAGPERAASCQRTDDHLPEEGRAKVLLHTNNRRE